MHTKNTALALALALAFGLAGCASFYGDAPKQKSEAAEIYTASPHDLGLEVSAIDGKDENFSLSRIIYIKPGEHRIRFETKVISEEKGRRRAYFDFTFIARAGKTYTYSSSQQGTLRVYQDTYLCLFEEDQNTPNARRSVFNEFRATAADATKISCKNVEFAAVE